MACLKMPEVNHVLIAGNLTKDPVVRKTANGISVINFCLASNHKYRDASNQWAEDVCYVGVVAWSKLADSCMAKLRKGSAVLVDGELQSRTWHAEDTSARTVVEIKAHRIQFLNKQEYQELSGYENGMTEPIAECQGIVEDYQFSEAHYSVGFEDAGAKDMLFGERVEVLTSGIELKLKPRNGQCE